MLHSGNYTRRYLKQRYFILHSCSSIIGLFLEQDSTMICNFTVLLSASCPGFMQSGLVDAHAPVTGVTPLINIKKHGSQLCKLKQVCSSQTNFLLWGRLHESNQGQRRQNDFWSGGTSTGVGHVGFPQDCVRLWWVDLGPYRGWGLVVHVVQVKCIKLVYFES